MLGRGGGETRSNEDVVTMLPSPTTATMMRESTPRYRFARRLAAACACAILFAPVASFGQQASSRRTSSPPLPPVPSSVMTSETAPVAPLPPVPEPAALAAPYRDTAQTAPKARTAAPQIGFGDGDVYPREGSIRLDRGTFRMANLRQPPPVDQPPVDQPPVDQPPVFQPPVEQPAGPGYTPSQTGGFSFESDFERLAGEMLTGPVQGVTAAQAAASSNSNDLGDLISMSSSVQGVASQRRAQTAFTPIIRGFKEGQIYTQSDGAYWLPARQDLDTILSKLDPADIQDVVIIEGPYGLRYGPAFSFIDVVRRPTPRYDSPEIHNRIGLTFLANGDQWYARDAVYGGGQNYGFRFNYGHRLGSDYYDGNSQTIPSSYNNRNVLGDIGYDLSPYQHLEFSYQRLDVTDTEYYLQVFDLDLMVTDGWNLRYIDDDPSGPWSRMTLEGWTNRTRFNGNMTPVAVERISSAVSDSEQILDAGVTDGVAIIGATNGTVLSSGGRLGFTFGDVEDVHINTGGDFRYIQQSINENYLALANSASQQADVDTVFPGGGFSTNQPRSWLRDPGVFAEVGMPLGFWTPAIGARIDFVDSFIRASELRPGSQLVGDLEKSDTLYAFYLTNDVEIDRNWTGHVSFGHAQRPPTLTERYADGLFLSVAQSGFTRVIGDPDLAFERNWQMDLGIDCDFDSFRARLNGYHAFVLDYITFDDNIIVPDSDPSGARLLRYINTRYATLAGFSFSCEYDLTDRVTPFATMYYIEGRDMVIHQPLPQMPPLDTRLGLRFHDPRGGRFWGIEFFARVVDNQDRVAYIRQGVSGAVAQLEQATPGFTTFNVRAYYNWTPQMHLIAGIDNMFDRNYLEHLDTRLGPQDPIGTFPSLYNFRPGFTPYAGFEWVF